MTNTAIVTLLLPARTPRAGRAHQPRSAAARRRGLSLPEAPITRTTSTVYGMSALDRGGRIADRAVIEAIAVVTGAVAGLLGVGIAMLAGYGLLAVIRTSGMYDVPDLVVSWPMRVTDDVTDAADQRRGIGGRCGSDVDCTRRLWRAGSTTIPPITPGTRLRVDATRTHLALRAAIDGTSAVSDHRYLWLPAPTRHRLGLRPGDRVLLAAHPQRQTLVVYPPAALDELLAHARSASEGGDRDE